MPKNLTIINSSVFGRFKLVHMPDLVDVCAQDSPPESCKPDLDKPQKNWSDPVYPLKKNKFKGLEKNSSFVTCETKKEFNSIKNEVAADVILYNGMLYVKGESDSIANADVYKIKSKRDLTAKAFRNLQNVTVDEIINHNSCSGPRAQPGREEQLQALNDRINALEEKKNLCGAEDLTKKEISSLKKRITKLEAESSSDKLFESLKNRISALEVNDQYFHYSNGGKLTVTVDDLDSRVAQMEGHGYNPRINALESFNLDERITDLETDRFWKVEDRLDKIESRISKTYSRYDDYDLLSMISKQAEKISYLEQQIDALASGQLGEPSFGLL